MSSVALATLLTLTATAKAEIPVWLNYTNFDARLNELTTAATVTAFTTTERAEIRSSVLTQLNTIYAGFAVNFTETQPLSGSYEQLTFGQTTSSTGLYGQADQIDFRNLTKTDTADIYTRNFAMFIDEFNGTTNRPEQIRQLSTSLAGTAAHELGHNLGLEHCDCYGRSGISPANYSNTAGIQNLGIMATGATGLGEVQRETPRTFGEWEKVKLSYGEGLLEEAPAVLSEIAGVHNTFASAQSVSLAPLPTVNLSTACLLGSIATAGQIDFYSFTGYAGQTFTAQLLGNVLDRMADPVDTLLDLYSPTQTLLFSDDDTEFSGNTFNSSGTYSNDTFFVNITLPTNGTYYLRVSGFNTGTGNYEMLIGTNPIVSTAVPEPSTLALLGVGLAGLTRVLGRRGKKRTA